MRRRSATRTGEGESGREAGERRVFSFQQKGVHDAQGDLGRCVSVLIEWESHADGVWHKLGGGFEDCALVSRSVGWLVTDGECAKVIAHHHNEAEEGVPLPGRGIMTIPGSAVLRVTDLAQHGTTYSRTSCPSSCPGPA